MVRSNNLAPFPQRREVWRTPLLGVALLIVAPALASAQSAPAPSMDEVTAAEISGLSEETRTEFAAALAAAADDTELSTEIHAQILRSTVRPGELSGERTNALYDRLGVVLRSDNPIPER